MTATAVVTGGTDGIGRALAAAASGAGALGHGGALCDLLGVSFAGEYDPAVAAHVDQLRVSGKPVSQAVAQILPFLDAPLDSPPARLTAVFEGRQVATGTPSFDTGNAARLHELTARLLTGLPR
jgi:NAD(P)-dependent dehydrogenase (short-subunit alcohol dehydrogenase family)